MKSNPWNTCRWCCKCCLYCQKPLPVVRPGSPSFPCPCRVVLVLSNQVCFASPLLLSSFLPFSFFQACPDPSSCCLLCMQQVGLGAWQWVMFKRQQWDGGSVFISPDEHAWRQSTGGLWSSRSVHSSWKSADTLYSSHPENDLIYSWWAATAAGSSLRLYPVSLHAAKNNIWATCYFKLQISEKFNVYSCVCLLPTVAFWTFKLLHPYNPRSYFFLLQLPEPGTQNDIKTKKSGKSEIRLPIG